MINRKVINKSTVVVIIHASSITDDSYSLCGVDLAGDDNRDLSYDEAEDTNEKITCQQCKELILHCKKINKNQLSKISVDLSDFGM